MARRQYRLTQFARRSEIRDSKEHIVASVSHANQSRVVIRATGERFSVARSGNQIKENGETPIARASFSGVYDLLGQDATLQWKPLSFWHGVFGWSHADGTVVMRYVPAGCGKYLVIVEQPAFNELRLVALGAYFLKLTGTDFVAWSAVAASINIV